MVGPSQSKTEFGVVISGLLYTAAATAVVVMGVIMIVQRYSRSLLGDEGYLMFTLPVSVPQLIWSKLIVALVWSAVTAVAILAALSRAMVSQPYWNELFPDLRYAWSSLVGQLTGGQIAAFTAEFLVLLLFSALGSYLMFYAAIALGHSFANHKILLSVVFYLAFSVALQTVASFGGIYGIIAAGENGFFFGDPRVWLQQLLLVGIALALLTAAVFYVGTHLMLKHRLNLQ